MDNIHLSRNKFWMACHAIWIKECTIQIFKKYDNFCSVYVDDILIPMKYENGNGYGDTIRYGETANFKIYRIQYGKETWIK